MLWIEATEFHFLTFFVDGLRRDFSIKNVPWIKYS